MFYIYSCIGYDRCVWSNHSLILQIHRVEESVFVASPRLSSTVLGSSILSFTHYSDPIDDRKRESVSGLDCLSLIFCFRLDEKYVEIYFVVELFVSSSTCVLEACTHTQTHARSTQKVQKDILTHIHTMNSGVVMNNQ